MTAPQGSPAWSGEGVTPMGCLRWCRHVSSFRVVSWRGSFGRTKPAHPFGVEPRPVSGRRGPLPPSGPVRFVLIVVHSAFRLDARPAAWQTDPHRGTRRANVVGRRDLVVERGMDLGP